MIRRKFDSFAIGALNSERIESALDLSVNLWIDIKGSSEIDFGIKVPNTDYINGIFFFAPFDVCASQLIDLSPSFRDGDFNQILFNQDCKTTVHAGNTFISDNQGQSYCVLPFSAEEGLEIDHRQGGTLFTLRFNLPAFSHECDELYFRFRIPYVLLDNLLSGPVDIKEAITSPIAPFRAMSSIEINQVRGLPNFIVQKLNSSKTTIKVTHIAIIASRQWEVNYSLTPYRIRLLENNIWDQYQPRLQTEKTPFRPTGYDRFVYQWLVKGDNESLQLEFSRKRITAVTMAFYLVVLILINLICEALIRLVL